MTKVGFVSLGCPKNLVDSEVMMGILAREGYELTPRADEAEVLVVNTCSFIEAAQKESVDAILEMAEHKKFGAAKKLIVAGCLVERFRAQILEQVPEVDAVVGTGEVERIIQAVEGDLRVLPAQPPAFLYHDLTPRIVTTPKHAAYIKIAEGCDHPCTFCIIPQLRGCVTGSHNSWESLRRPKICCGCDFCTLIRIASHRNCWIPSRRMRGWRSTWTCRCSTPAATCLRA